jgi:hypothetical protein
MSLKKINIRTVVLVLLLIAAAAMRLVNVKYIALSNFTPVGAIALFGGAYFTDKWKAYLVVLATLFVSDIAINYMYTSKLILWYGGSFWVYLCFAIMVFVGTLIKKVSFVNVSAASLVSVLIHWLIMDMPWLYSVALYPHTLAGYGQSLVAAIPFEKNMVLGDALYCTLLFGGFELAKSKYVVLRTKRELAV